MTPKKLMTIALSLAFACVAGVAIYLIVILSNLPQIIKVADYEPLLVSQVYDRKGEKIGEFFREKRILVPYEQIPKHIINAFISSEDASFFEHGGINYVAIVRAMIANIKSGRRKQGASTITQQVARSLLLTREKTYTRKIKEVVLSYKMEANLTKEEILWLYLNQIYLGQGSYGVAMATQIYFRKELQDITVAEAALLAGLPQAPSRYSPIYNPSSAKARQRYVLGRMKEEEFITEDEREQAAESPLQVYVRKNYKELAPFYLETVRQLLVKHVGEENVLDNGIKVYTSLDLDKQKEAQTQLQIGLRQLDKRQGYRGPLKSLTEPKEIAEMLLKTRNSLMDEVSPLRILNPDGTIKSKGPLNLAGVDENGKELPNLPHYISVDKIVKAIVTSVDDKWGLVTVRFAESKGLIDFESMDWAREPDPNVRYEYDKIEKASEALKKGDVIQVRIVGRKFYSSRIRKELSDLKKAQGKKYKAPEDLPEFKKFAHVELEQEPVAEAALISFDQNNQDIIAMVGGYDFSRSKFNRTYQSLRQTGSAFKALVYAAALDKGYTPATPIIDAPIVFEEEDKEEGQEEVDTAEEVQTKKWKPMNHSNKFVGDILFRNALIRSLNVPTVKIIEKLSVDWVASYGRRLGIFSPLNMDFTLALGSSGITLYEMTKSFAQLGNLGKRMSPIIIHKVEDKDGNVLLEKLSLDDRFTDSLGELEKQYELKRKAFLKLKALEEKTADNNSEKEAEGTEKVDTITVTTKNPETGEDEEVSFSKKELLAEPPFYFENSRQLIKPTTAYITTSLLQGVVEEPRGTGGRARSLGRPVAGKTGTTNGYFDGYFVGYTPDISTGVWVGFDKEKTLGRGEVGGKAALPIWLEYMKFAHEGLPARNFPVPEGIVFANIDNESGKLATANSQQVVKQAFVEGTEPTELNTESDSDEDQDFYKEELAE